VFAVPIVSFLPRARRRCVSTLSSPDVLRRTGGRSIKSIVYDEREIARRVAELGADVTAAYPDGDLLVLGLLKGSFIFLSDLVRKIERPIQIDFLVATSYGADKVSSGTVRLLYDPETKLEGKHILLVEDIIDSGRTLQRLLGLLGRRRPRSLAICALLDKELAPVRPPELRFVGFRAPPAFLVGYGLDHAENYRHLPFIADLDS
jgi:hypoxanthine phosphoribosyltransferase